MVVDGGLVFQAITALVLAGAVYGGIRSDIRGIHEHLRRVEKSADQAHERIDNLKVCRHDH